MPPALRKAHQTLDAAVDSLYRPHPFADDRERAEHLLAPLLSAAPQKPKRARAGS